ncbi:DNA replication complex GINS protein PSF1-like [Anneissia japonica]|uniref:DNA replication complex GINS protein PSF1-like n=1 Tax=Anneissia japonica TaxID=1529436 RepID=UPI0014254AFD|nr:DNA replication complex GINS protein PSF1-like [Anneissia japonica]
MYGELALELIRDLQRSLDGSLLTFNDDGVRQVLEEMRALFHQNQVDVSSSTAGETRMLAGVQFRHDCLHRNKRLLLAYLYNRLQVIRQMRWEFGSVLPADVKHNLSENEVQWFGRYNKSLAKYMRSLGSDGLDLTQNTKPPKGLYIEVRCLVDHGEFETEDGTIIVLNKNCQHFLLRSQCEHLVRQGILEHIIS